MANERDILRDAIIGTEKEIFAEAFGLDDLTHDETGDRSLEAMGEGLEGQHEPEEEGEETETEAGKGETQTENKSAETEAKAETETEPPKPEDQHDKGLVPGHRLREQTDRARKAEADLAAANARIAEAEANYRKQIDALNAKYDGVIAAIQQRQPVQPAPQPPKAEEVPDLLENPQAFAEFVRKGPQGQFEALQKQLRDMRVENSLELAHVRHGDAFTKAFEAAKALDPRNEESRATIQRIYTATNPGEALVSWHKRNETLREVGDDPTAYKAKIAEDTRKALMADPEFRKQLIEELRGEALTGDGGRARTVTTKLPGSLGRAAGGNTRAPNDAAIDGSDQAIFDSVFNAT